MDGRGVAGNIMESPLLREVIRSEDTVAAQEAIMSALVCGKRSSSVFQELPHTPPPASKRIRCPDSIAFPIAAAAAIASPTAATADATVSSPLQPSLSPSSSVNHGKNDSGGYRSSPIAHLRCLFPEMDPQILQRALEACNSNMDSAIKSLKELQSGAAGRNFSSASCKTSVKMGTNVLLSSEDAAARNSFSAENLPPDGSGWIELFVREMTNASHINDARSRTSRMLELLEKSIKARLGAGAAYSLQEESKKLKEQVEALVRENTILKRAVAIQNERQKDCEAGSQELLQLKQMVSQYQEQLRTLELNNYTLAMHLKQALQNSTIPGNFDHDVF